MLDNQNAFLNDNNNEHKMSSSKKSKLENSLKKGNKFKDPKSSHSPPPPPPPPTPPKATNDIANMSTNKNTNATHDAEYTKLLEYFIQVLGSLVKDVKISKEGFYPAVCIQSLSHHI